MYHHYSIRGMGSQSTIGCFSKSCFAFDIDINGHKKPNIVGYDVFSFSMYPQTSEFLPHGVNGGYDSQAGKYKKLTEEEIIQNCGGGGNGGTCAARVVADGFKINY